VRTEVPHDVDVTAEATPGVVVADFMKRTVPPAAMIIAAWSTAGP